MRIAFLCILLCLTGASCRRYSEIKLLKVTVLENFPSASAIEYYNDRIYLIGDDAPVMLVTDRTYNILDTIRFLQDTSYRISKSTKPDIESAALVHNDGEAELFALGSFSTEERGKLFSFSLADPIKVGRQDLFPLFKKMGRKALNIEGMAITGDLMILANRANPEQPSNQLLVTPFWENAYSFHAIELKLPTAKLAGISGLCYIEKRDLLLFTASTEETPNAIEDGVIGDSYLGLIQNFSSHRKQTVLQPHALINLSQKDKRFINQKIESLCMEKMDGRELTLHLCADNDNGRSTLFKVLLSL